MKRRTMFILSVLLLVLFGINPLSRTAEINLLALSVSKFGANVHSTNQDNLDRMAVPKVREFDRWLRSIDDDGQMLALEGQVQALTGNYETAEALLRQALKTQGLYSIASVRLVKLLWDMGEVEESITMARDSGFWRRSLEVLIEELYRSATDYAQQGDYEQAEAQLELVALVEPASPEPYYALGGMSWAMGKPGKVLWANERALALDHQPSAKRSVAQGQVFLIRNQFPEAISAFQEATSLDPNSGLAHSFLGEALRKAGLIQEAYQVYEEATRFSPDYGWNYVALAEISLELGRVDEARHWYSLVMMVDPTLEYLVPKWAR